MSMIGEIINDGRTFVDWCVVEADGYVHPQSSKDAAKRLAAQYRRWGLPKPIRVMRRVTLVDYPNGRRWGARVQVISGPGAVENPYPGE